jgi:LPXTG-motif cell wall-anchored protein
VVVVPEEGITGGTETLTPTVTSLPRTGADLTALWLTGLLMALVGGAFMLTSRRPTGPAGRHVLR